MKVKLLKKIRKQYFVSYKSDTIYIAGFFKFAFVKKDFTSYYNINSIYTINRFCLDNSFINHNEFKKYDLKKQIKATFLKFNPNK